MPDHQLLDDNFNQQRIPPALQRWNWYLRHAVLILGLNLIVLLMLSILPYCPTWINDVASIVLLLFIILGMYAITGYTCWKGFKWNAVGSFLGASIMFLSAFILIMRNSNTLKDIFGPKLIAYFNIPENMTRDTLDLVILGLGYSIITIPIAEILVILGLMTQGLKARWLQRSNKDNGSNE